jgi:hypothetical protein
MSEEALVMRVLASTTHMSVQLLREWTVVKLLGWVAQVRRIAGEPLREQ